MKVFNFVVDSCNSVVFDEDGSSSHAEGNKDSNAGREAIDQGDSKWSDEFAEEIDSTHLRVELLQVIGVVLGYHYNPIALDRYGVDDRGELFNTGE